MKTVFTSHEIAHVWANQSAPHGKSPGAVSFNGPVIYSYQTAMARHIEHKGKRAIVLNVASYSVSTSKHQHRIRMAIPDGITLFRVNDNQRGTNLRFTGDELFTHYIEQAAKQEAKATLPRIRQTTRDSHKAQAAHYLEQARAVATFYGLRKKVDEKAVSRLAAAKAKAEKREAIERAKRDAKEKADQETAYRCWITRADLPDDVSSYFNARLFPIAFRVEGDELVSTLGARVPLRAAQVAYRFAMSKRNAWMHVPKCGQCGCDALACQSHDNTEIIAQWRSLPRGWHENGETCEVGMYRLNAINEHGIVAGCHRITWSELERLAPVLA